MRRRTLIGLIALGVVVFLALSGLLARGFSVSGAESAAITHLVTAEAQGNPDGVIALISGCRANAACRSRAATNASALKRAGSISIVQITPSTSFALGGSTGTERVVWLAGSSLPRVQCVRVRRTGNLLKGFEIHLLKASVRIKTDSECPSRY